MKLDKYVAIYNNGNVAFYWIKKSKAYELFRLEKDECSVEDYIEGHIDALQIYEEDAYVTDIYIGIDFIKEEKKFTLDEIKKHHNP